MRVLNEQVEQCDVLISVIGKDWLYARDEHGARRLDNPNDFVRVEIEAALARDKRVIPVLVGQLPMPSADQLPEGLKPLARRHAVRLTHERFRADTQALIAAVQRALKIAEEARVAQRQAETEAKRRAEDEAAERGRQRREADAEQRHKEAAEAKRREDEDAQCRRQAEAERQAEAQRRRADERRLREEAEAKRRAEAKERRLLRHSRLRPYWPVLAGGLLLGVAVLMAIGMWMASTPSPPVKPAAPYVCPQIYPGGRSGPQP